MIGGRAYGYTTPEFAEPAYQDAVNRQHTDQPAQHMYIDIICGCCHKVIPVPVYCGKRFCQICSVLRQSRVRTRLNWLVDQITPTPPYGFSHLTLTVRNQPDLKIMVQHLLDSFRRLRQRPFWKKRVLGGGYVIEITGSPGDWHAHLHIIIEARYMLQTHLKDVWESCSGGTGVWIERIKKTGITSYLTKYLTKAGVSDDVIDAMSDALKGARLFSPFGVWYSKYGKFVKEIALCSECNASDFMLKAILYTGKFGGGYARYN